MGEGLLRRYRPRVNPLNLEAAVLGVHWVCTRCARALGVLVLSVCSCSRCALGRVVAGRFWCSYAWVSLTQTAPVRPRARCVGACSPVCAPVCACVRLCRRVRARVCVPLRGVCGGVAAGWVVLWRCWRWCGGAVIPLFSLRCGVAWCGAIPLFLFLSLRWCAAVWRCGVPLFRWVVLGGGGGLYLFALLSIARCALGVPRWCIVLCIVLCIVMCSYRSLSLSASYRLSHASLTN